MTAVVDYGVGNLFSLTASLKKIGEEVTVTSDKSVILGADRIILPGVGAFADAMQKLRAAGLDQTLKDAAAKGTPLLGICLGMQLLFDSSSEFGEHKGLGLIPGKVVGLKDKISLKIPHIGWNSLEFYDKDGLFADFSGGEFVYYVHSFFAETQKKYILAVSDYGIKVTGAVKNKNVYGTQFHPEKSDADGLRILKAFVSL